MVAKPVIMAVVVMAGGEAGNDGAGGDGDQGSVSDGNKWSWLIKDDDEYVNIRNNTY